MKYEVLALDASFTGFAAQLSGEGEEDEVHFWSTEPPKRNKKGRLPAYLRYDAPPAQGRVFRCRYLAHKVLDLVRKNAPELIIIEGYAFNAKGSSGVSLGELGGILRDRLIDYPEYFIEATPTELKKFSTGKGNASKVQVASALSSRYGRIFKTDNHADVFGLARLGMCILGLESAKTKPQRQVVQQLQRSAGMTEE
jgi:Holliday junction resolvasome RuvABC endonuclease subunit